MAKNKMLKTSLQFHRKKKTFKNALEIKLILLVCHIFKHSLNNLICPLINLIYMYVRVR